MDRRAPRPASPACSTGDSNTWKSWCGLLPLDTGVVVVAAGRGTRFGGTLPKQYSLLAGRPVLLHAIRPFASHPDVAHIVVVLPPADAGTPPDWLTELCGG